MYFKVLHFIYLMYNILHHFKSSLYCICSYFYNLYERMVFPYRTRFSLMFKVFSLSYKVFPLSFDNDLVVFLPASHVDLPVLLFHSSLATIKVLYFAIFILKLIHHMHMKRLSQSV